MFKLNSPIPSSYQSSAKDGIYPVIGASASVPDEDDGILIVATRNNNITMKVKVGVNCHKISVQATPASEWVTL